MIRRILLAAAVLVVGAAGAARADNAVPTFTKDVAPIFYKNCAECHRPTMFAPMSLVSYDDARPWLRSIKQRVVSRTMPPWGSDQPHGIFKNDPRLTEEEIATIVAWIDGGAPKGEEKDLPALPSFTEGWTIGKPDAVFTMQEEYKIPAAGTIEYQYIRIPVNLPEDRWFKAIEIKPGARAHVHHVIAYTQPSGAEISPNGVLGPTNIGGVTPNKPGVVFPDGVARLLRGKHDIILQMHYTTNGTPAIDRTEVGIIFAKEPPKKVAAGGMALNPRFVIPAGDGNAEVRAVQAIAQDTMLTTLTPHMHVRGKDMTYIAHYPDGTSETLLSVPKYDFNWQITYELAQPKLLPKGTRVEVIAHYDNSTANKYNPDPTKDVRWGDQTWEEMMIGFWGTVREMPAKEATPQQR
jgi:mono/diheme cytochrome c family protein